MDSIGPDLFFFCAFMDAILDFYTIIYMPGSPNNIVYKLQFFNSSVG